MSLPRSTMELTAELVALVERTEPDPGPTPDLLAPSVADLEAGARALLASRPDGPLWLFAYGSLIWKPELEHLESRQALVRGWHRRFCMRLTRWRGTREMPGLMMALDRGGSCAGLAYRLSDADAHGQLVRLLARETDSRRPTNVPRWLRLVTPEGPLRALAFVASPYGANYVGRLPQQVVARTLARAAGHWGSGAQYLYNTVAQLEAHGIRDRNLWALQARVAAEIRALRMPLAA
ncbi:gamma-glutamylcyclotransferase [Devosia sp. A16]|uniref:gamma-glutamylcyclotransferase n=1 Tax=Devosia sp. A16 TaxID=1736675 RepID=UPI0006D7E9F4|nr:gamma-glutamylcyclotransferase [Devosia sp. A16]